MKQDSRHSYVRLLGKLIGLVGRGAPLPLLAMVAVSLAVMGANVLVFHLLEAVLSQLAGPERLSEIAGAILVAGAVILIRELLEMVADPIAAYVVGKASAVLTEAMNQKSSGWKSSTSRPWRRTSVWSWPRPGPWGRSRC